MIDSIQILQSVKDVKNHYSKATGIPCMILDMFHHRIVEGGNAEADTIFTLIDKDWTKHSTETHLHNAQLSQRFGGSYTYFCIISMLYWVSPVIINGKMDYAIIAGPVITLEPSELLEEDLLKDYKDRGQLLEVLSTIPQIEISRIHNLSEVLRMCSGWASGYSEHRMVETRHSLEVQSRVSESIQDLKSKNGGEFLCYPIEKETALQHAIQWGERKKAIAIMNDLLGIVFFSSGNSYDLITFRVMEIISLLSRAAVRGGASEEKVFAKSLTCQKEIRYYSSLEGLSLWLSKVLHSYIDMVFTSPESEYEPTIAKALRYINAHYSEHLSLEDTAHNVNLSPNYFSTLFNTTMKTSFSSYIHTIRIEHAQTLLIDTSLSIIDIAGMVGFEEQSYFSKIFKDITTYSPGKYRKRGGRLQYENHEIHN